MATFRALLDAVAQKPIETAEIPPEHFADTWPNKPTEPVLIGLRLVSENELQKGRAQAARRAWEDFPVEGRDEDERVDCYNSALTSWVVASAQCRADDASKPWLPLAHDNLPLALTSAGLRALWHRVEAMSIAHSPISPEATDDDVGRLIAAVKGGSAWTSADPQTQRLARRLLKRALTILAI